MPRARAAPSSISGRTASRGSMRLSRRARGSPQAPVSSNLSPGRLPVLLGPGRVTPSPSAGRAQRPGRFFPPLVRDRPTPRGHGTLEIVVALFDAEGGFVTQTAERAVVNLDAAAAERDPAITLHWELPDIKPGTYTVRFVMRAPRITGMTTMNHELKVY